MKKLFAIILVALLPFCTTFAQKDAQAKKVLDATASKLAKMKGIKAQFNITNFNGTTEQGSTSGTLCLSGNKMKIVTPDMMTWFDGKTQWSYVPQNEEVNVTTPSKAEQQQMNPYSFIGLYKKGYNYTMTKTTVQGKPVYEVRLTAEKGSAHVQEVRADISMDYTPVSIRVRQGKSQWTRIRVSSLAGGQKFSDATFTFPKNEYSKAEIIDLR